MILAVAMAVAVAVGPLVWAIRHGGRSDWNDAEIRSPLGAFQAELGNESLETIVLEESILYLPIPVGSMSV
jgi:hypothetical protein